MIRWRFILLSRVVVLLFISLTLRMDAEVLNPTDNTFQFRTRTWRVESGLPQNAVQAVAQTGDGFLWLGTQHGLARFDGYEFEWFDHPDLKSERINALAIAADGALWAGTATLGVYRIQGKQATHFSLAGFADSRVLSLCADPDGTVWIGTLLGLAKFDGKEIKEAAENDFLNKEAVRAIARRNDGVHWFATSAQIIASSNAVPVRRLGQQDGIRNLYVRTLMVDDRGVLWIGSNAGLACLRRGRLIHYTKADGLPDNTVSALFQDSRQRLWAGTFNGLCRKVGESFVPVRSDDAEPFDQIFAIAEDRENNIWAGFKDGLIRLREDRFKTYLTRDGLAHNNVISVLGDGPGLWLGTWGGGLHHFKNGEVTMWSKDAYPVLKNDLILAMHKARDGSLWFGTDYDGGLYRLKDAELTRFREAAPLRSQAIRDIHEDHQGNLWIATSYGIIRRQDDVFRKFLLRDGLPNFMVRCIAEDAANVLWVGTENGLARRNGEMFTTEALQTNLPSQTILSLYADDATNLWIGTAEGLACLSTGKISTYGARQSRLTNAIVEIIEDDLGFLWLSSDRGILRVEKKDLLRAGEGQTINCEHFGENDGMISSVCVGTAKPAACKSDDGLLWFATTRGVVTTDERRQLKTNQLPPSVFITKFVANKSSLPISKADLTLPPGNDNLEFEYTALSFRDPERNRFKYRLTGFDIEWVDAGSRRAAFYNNLAPGNYRFNVIACNNDGVWNELGANVKFTLFPHFWQTKSFQALALLTLAFLAAFSARQITKKRLQARLTRLEQEHALEKERTRIAQDMHDDLGARITEILLVGKSTLHNGKDPQTVANNVGRICDAAQEIATDLNAIVFAVNPKHDSLEHFVAYINKYVEKYLGSTQMRCRLDVPVDVPDLPVSSEVRHNVVMCIKEALNNALKHAQASEISVEVAFDKSILSISLSDDGKGFDGSGTDNLGNGLPGMKKRMEDIGGRLELHSLPGKGTRIRLEIPLNR